MKFAKTLTTVLVSSLLASSLLCSCNANPEPEIELPEDEILVLCGYKNGFEGYSSSKLFILSDGRVFCSQERILRYPLYYSEGITDEQRIELLEKYTAPVAVIPEDDMLKLYGYMVNIDPDSDFVYKDEYVTDIGTDYTEVYVDGKSIRISESGEMTGSLDDRNARKADALISRKLISCGIIGYPNVYSGNEVFLDTLECPKDVSLINTRRIITSIEELKAFENETGLMLSKLDGFEYFSDPDYDSFSQMCIAVQIFVCPFMDEPDKPEAFIVSDDYVGFATLEEGSSGPLTYQGKYKTWCHVVQLPYYPSEGTAPYDAFLN